MVDQNSENPGPPPDPTAEPEPEVVEEVGEVDVKSETEGLKNALLEERNRRHQAEAQAQFLRDWADKNQRPTEPEERIDPEDFITVKEAERIFNKKVSEVIGPQQEVQRRMMIAQQEAQAKKDHGDWEDVYSRFVESKLRSDSDFHRMIYASSNPPETAYNWAIAQPAYRKEIVKQATSKKINTINKNVDRGNTLAAAGGGGNSGRSDVADKFKTMTRDEIEREIARVKGI